MGQEDSSVGLHICAPRMRASLRPRTCTCRDQLLNSGRSCSLADVVSLDTWPSRRVTGKAAEEAVERSVRSMGTLASATTRLSRVPDRREDSDHLAAVVALATWHIYRGSHEAAILAACDQRNHCSPRYLRGTIISCWWKECWYSGKIPYDQSRTGHPVREDLIVGPGACFPALLRMSKSVRLG